MAAQDIVEPEHRECTDNTNVRAYCGTINNPTEDDYERMHSLTYDYVLYCNEIGDKNGTPHIQWYIYHDGKIRFKSLKKALPRANIRACNGNAQQNYIYITKQLKPGEQPHYEKGTIPRKGKRNDLDVVKECLEETGKMRSVVRVARNAVSVKMAECILKYTERERDFRPRIIWIYGPTGCGKSATAVRMCDEKPYFASNGKWFEGYDAHKCIILNDVREDFMPWRDLLDFTDRYGCKVQFKGGSRQLLAETMIFTSPYHPMNLYRSQVREDVIQFIRRMEQIIKLDYTAEFPKPEFPDGFLDDIEED